jgi:hypothetical protein
MIAELILSIGGSRPGRSVSVVAGWFGKTRFHAHFTRPVKIKPINHAIAIEDMSSVRTWKTSGVYSAYWGNDEYVTLQIVR